jgi:hypothetical protein
MIHGTEADRRLTYAVAGSATANSGRADLPTIAPNATVTDAVTESPSAHATAERPGVPGATAQRVTAKIAAFVAGGNKSLPEPIRGDRNGYWFPMLLFGFLILLAPLVYQPADSSGAGYVWNPAMNSTTHISGIAFAPLQQFGTCDGASGDPISVALYWFCVAMFGPLISLLWYHRRAQRRGEATQTGWHLLYASTSLALYVVLFPVIEFIALSLPPGTSRLSAADVRFIDFLTVGTFVLGLAVAATAAMPARWGRPVSVRRWTVGGLGVLLTIASAATIEFVAYLQPRNSYGALLIIAVGLLALSLVERGRVCVTVAVLFTAAALLFNLVGLRTVLHWLGFHVSGHWSSVGTAFANLLLPGGILLVGGLVGMVRVAAGRFARVSRAV